MLNLSLILLSLPASFFYVYFTMDVRVFSMIYNAFLPNISKNFHFPFYKYKMVRSTRSVSEIEFLKDVTPTGSDKPGGATPR